MLCYCDVTKDVEKMFEPKVGKLSSSLGYYIIMTFVIDTFLLVLLWGRQEMCAELLGDLLRRLGRKWENSFEADIVETD